MFIVQLSRIRNLFFVYINRIRFSLYGVNYGRNLKIHGSIGIKLAVRAKVIIGCNFYSSNGHFINPISRNINGCISVNKDAEIIIGDNVAISSTSIWARKSIKIGDNVKIGGDSLVLDSDYHSIDHISRRSKAYDIPLNKSVVIEDDVLIGARCIVLKGVTIGARSVIGAGSVVTKSIPADSIAAGNPCRVIHK